MKKFLAVLLFMLGMTNFAGRRKMHKQERAQKCMNLC